jgi:hypothetical protein
MLKGTDPLKQNHESNAYGIYAGYIKGVWTVMLKTLGYPIRIKGKVLYGSFEELKDKWELD